MKRTIAMVLLVSALFGLVSATAFAVDKKKLETAEKVLGKMGEASELGEYLAAYTRLGDALERVPKGVKKAKGFFDKASGPLSAAVNATLLYKSVGEYKSANAATRGKIGGEVAEKFFDLISPVVNATPQGALINVSIQVGISCYKSMMASVAQYQLGQAKSGMYAGMAVINGDDYIDDSSKYYNLACWLYVDKIPTGTIFSKVSNLEKIDASGGYAQIALACYKDGASIDDITNVISALVAIDNLNAQKAQALRDAEAKQAQDKLKAEQKKKEDESKKAVTKAQQDAAKARDANKKIIQSYCKFDNPADVWKVMDTHKFANDLYRVWANSYPKTITQTRPKNKADQDIIQSFCKFGNPAAVWDVMNKHKFAGDLLKKWANSYYKP